MVELWIRVESNAVRAPALVELAERLGVKPPTALGHIVALYGELAEHGTLGSLVGVSDYGLERWACWEGKPGQFAQAFRAIYVASDDTVTSWLERHGQLIAAMERDRQRKRKAHKPEPARRESGNAQEVPRPFHGTSTEQSGNGTDVSPEGQGKLRALHRHRHRPEPSVVDPDGSTTGPSAPKKVTWLTPYYEAWHEAYGDALFPGGEAAKVFAELERATPREKLALAFRKYLREFGGERARYVSVTRFGQTLAAWTVKDEPVGTSKPVSAAQARELLKRANAEDLLVEVPEDGFPSLAVFRSVLSDVIQAAEVQRLAHENPGARIPAPDQRAIAERVEEIVDDPDSP